MADFTLKYKKVKEWYKSYIVDRVDSMTWSQFVIEFTNWAFQESSMQLKMVDFEQLRQTTDMSVDEYTDKFIELL